jgi:hypothetical protein
VCALEWVDVSLCVCVSVRMCVFVLLCAHTFGIYSLLWRLLSVLWGMPISTVGEKSEKREGKVREVCFAAKGQLSPGRTFHNQLLLSKFVLHCSLKEGCSFLCQTLRTFV